MNELFGQSNKAFQVYNGRKVMKSQEPSYHDGLKNSKQEQNLQKNSKNNWIEMWRVRKERTTSQLKHKKI